ncbi:MAG: hypothetical protein U1G07_05865 [Verrucomicrobiota bacterium]
MNDEELINKLEKLKEYGLKIRQARHEIESLTKEVDPLLDELLEAYPTKENLFKCFVDSEGYFKNKGASDYVGKDKTKRTQKTTIHHKTMAKVLKSPMSFKDLLAELQKEGPSLTEEQLKADVEAFKKRGTVRESKGKLEWVPKS